MPTYRPGYVWDGTQWVQFGPEVASSAIAYQASAPTSPATGSLWVDADDDVPAINTNNFLTISNAASTYSPISTTGLVLINKISASAISAININNIFTSDYQNYRVLFNGSCSASTDTYIRMRASGTDATANYAHAMLFTEAASGPNRDSNANWIQWFAGPARTGKMVMSIDMFSPREASFSGITINSYGYTSSGTTTSWMGGGTQFTNTQFDGFSLYPGSGTLTGTVLIYGYK